LAPLGELLADRSVTKVMHSCGEDLEVFYHRFERFPEPVFDTQVGAALAGLGYSLGYASLVAELCGVELPKGETRSNWVRRPLRDSQLRYAAWDVVYLLPAYRKLEEELRRRGREGWVEEEVAELFDAERFLPDPETVYLQAAHSSMSRRELAILRTVAGWRERQARRRDLPRNFVLPQRALPELARRKPRDRRQLASVSGLRDADRKRHGKTLLRLVADAMELPDSELPPKLRRPVDLAPHRREVDRLRKAVARKAEELDLPRELLATRRVAEGMVRRAHGDDGPVVPESTTSWRRRILAELAERVLTPADL
jgi:ribonuclease D